MKKLFTVLALGALLFNVPAFADDVVDDVADDVRGDGTYGMAGCGLGSMLFDNNTKVNQVLAATTNGTSGNQTFGISTGTSNCTENGLVKLDKETEAYVEVNYDVLQNDIAQGQGETLAGLATLMGCQAQPFGQAMQANYASLASAENASVFLNNVQVTLAKQPTACETL